jgi:DNA polymerase-3 subunit epsilon
MKVLWLDTETTGLNSEKNGIIQLAVIIDIDGEEKFRKTYLMRPTGRTAEDKALEVNGYTREQIAGFTPWEQVHKEFTDDLSQFVDKFNRDDKFILGGQNVEFDSRFIMSWFKSCGDNYWFSWVKAGAVIDTLPMVTFLQWCEKVPMLENRKNETLCKHFGIDLSNAHDAMADIEATRAVAVKMRELIG